MLVWAKTGLVEGDVGMVTGNKEAVTSARVARPVDADFAAFTDVHLGALAIILVLTSELNVLELVQHFRDSIGWLGQHGLHRHAHHKCHMLLQLLQSGTGGLQGLRGILGGRGGGGEGGREGWGAGGRALEEGGG